MRRASRRDAPKTVFTPKKVERCEECGGTLRWKTSSGNRPVSFPGFGFPLQVAGLSTATCARCKAPHAAVANADRFRRTIMLQILEKPGPLTAEEIVFLRRSLKLTGGKFAGLVGVSREHVSHIEQGHAPNLGTAADRLARMMIAVKLAPTLKLLKKLLGRLDEQIGTRSRRKAVRHSSYSVYLASRAA